jgi:hypothetical protein
LIPFYHKPFNYFQIPKQIGVSNKIGGEVDMIARYDMRNLGARGVGLITPDGKWCAVCLIIGTLT